MGSSGAGVAGSATVASSAGGAASGSPGFVTFGSSDISSSPSAWHLPTCPRCRSPNCSAHQRATLALSVNFSRKGDIYRSILIRGLGVVPLVNFPVYPPSPAMPPTLGQNLKDRPGER
ncbi:hypothetical protein L3i22_022990 [Actinoplanes sp. L3-i22]|nr:hypothetical protein L3i22_022990 [Actinoplanes sp. L3-i22]